MKKFRMIYTLQEKDCLKTNF